MNCRRLFLSAVLLGTLATAQARAHFLFIHIGPPAEAGRVAEVYFSERAEAGDPKFLKKVAHTQLWLRIAADQVQPLKIHKAADRLRAFLPMSGSVIVSGTCEYGVLARPKQIPFLLRYYPKAMAGNPEELKRLQPLNKTPFEIVGTVEGDRLQLVALREGKPIPGAEFHTVDAKLANEKLVAGTDGVATWKPTSPGRYSVYTQLTTKTQGEVAGKKYEEIREFATLAFTWPLERKGADPKAVELFEEAVAARAQWKGFPGFRARIAGQVDDRAFTGSVTIDADGTAHLELDETSGVNWIQEQLESLAMHRGASAADAPAQRQKPVVRFAEERDAHPLGRLLIFEGGRFASSYRVKDKQLLVVNRHMGKQNMTITVLENDRNQDGRFLPRSYTVQYWDAATGALQRTETVQERWQRVGDFDLPTHHTVTSASDAGLTVRTFTLTEHQLIKKRVSAKAGEATR